MLQDIKNTTGQWEPIVGSEPSPAFKIWAAMGTEVRENKATMSINFQNWNYFAEWCQSQVGYGLPGYIINKDVLKPGNLEYNEDVCVFIPQELNSFLKE